jgi:hypothetical protein
MKVVTAIRTEVTRIAYTTSHTVNSTYIAAVHQVICQIGQRIVTGIILEHRSGQLYLYPDCPQVAEFWAMTQEHVNHSGKPRLGAWASLNLRECTSYNLGITQDSVGQ